MAEVKWSDEDGDEGRVTAGREAVVELMADDRGEAEEAVEADLADEVVALVELTNAAGEVVASFVPRDAAVELVLALAQAVAGDDDLTTLAGELRAMAEDALLPSGQPLTAEGAAAWAEGWLLTLAQLGVRPAAEGAQS